MADQRKSERWIVCYRRYSSDEWSERVFYSKSGAIQFKNEYLYDRGFEAQAVIKHFVEAKESS